MQGDLPFSRCADALYRSAARHIGPSEEDQRAMLATLGYASLDDLLTAALPSYAKPPASLAALPAPRTEQEALADLRRLAARNTVAVSMIGLGYYGTVTPAVIRRNVLENPAWYTAYTPYQPEISQGRLEALLNFQTMVCDLTGLDVANASLLDEASAAAEAMTLAFRVAGAGAAGLPRRRRLPAADPRRAAHPRRAPRHRAARRAASPRTPTSAGVFGVLLQYPGASGEVRDLAPVIEAAHAAGARVAVAADILALTLLKPPGELGADIALGTTQRFGVPLFYGGPHAAYLAVRDDLRRQLPGRLVGVSVDADGNPAYRLALQAREQHIRREKATSNICTAQVLLAVVAAMYACYHGPDGLTAIARRVHRHAMTLAATLKDYGLLTSGGAAFDTIGVRLPGPTEARAALLRAREAGYNLYDAGGGVVQVSCDETTTPEHLRDVVAALVGASMVGTGLDAADVRLSAAGGDAIPASLARTSKFLTHPMFSAHHSETGMLRYLRRLSDLDVALDRSMIPLGSCTMKLNATAEMEAVTWPEFAGLHPFAPGAGRRGLRRADRRPGALAVRGDRLRRLLPAAERRLGGRARRPARHPGLPPLARRRGARRLPDPRVRARHERGVRGPRRPAGRGRQLRRATARSTSATCAPSSPPTRGGWPRSWSPTRPPTGCTRRRSPPSRTWSTRPAARSTSTAPTSTPSPGWRRPPSSAGTCPTSTCTRRSASRTAAAAPAWARSPRRRTSPRSCPGQGRPGGRRASAGTRSRARRTGRPASCRSRGRTSP